MRKLSVLLGLLAGIAVALQAPGNGAAEVVASRVRGWRGALRVGANIPLAFAAVLSPAPIGPFPPPALRTGRADFPHPALQWDHAFRTRNAGSGSRSRCRWLAFPRLPEAARLHPRGVPRRRATGPVHAPAAPSLHSARPLRLRM